jgi:uncharacterized damage-inducible protein DinB
VRAVTGALLVDAFAHHVWASTRLLDACMELSPEQLETSVPGTYGSILDTARHLVGSDAWYLFRITGDRSHVIDEDHMSVAELRSAMEGHGSKWSGILASDPDPDAVLEGRNDDGSVTHAATGVRIAQVLHHGTDHRSQICTALTTLGIEPPGIDVWAYGEHTGRVVEAPPPS